MSEQTSLIHTQMAKIQADVKAVPKDKSVSGGGANYKYQGINEIMIMLNPILKKHDVFITTADITPIETREIIKSGKPWLHTVLLVTYQFNATDGSFIQSKGIGTGQDNSDKLTNKALSYAFKYMLMQTFCIATDDDPDAVKVTMDEKLVHCPICEDEVYSKANHRCTKCKKTLAEIQAWVAEKKKKEMQK